MKTLGAFACSRPKLWENFSVTSTRTFGRGEEIRLSSGLTWIGSELSSSNFNSSVRAERSFAIRYLNIVIKPLCGNLDYLANSYFRSWNSVCVLRSQIATQSERCFFWITLFGRALAQFSRFLDRNSFRLRKTQARECT